ncbi:MAG: hypothetical protein WA584_18065 [Pyrinomonadaceae bacterium]
MKGHIRFFALKSFVLAAVMLFSSAAAFADNSDVASAKGVSDRTISTISANLSKKLQVDLADNTATVKISDIERQQLSKNQVDFKGSAFCILKSENTQLPIKFEAKINPQTQDVSDINYSFVEENDEFSPTTTEEVLMKELMKQVSVDYKTDSIVIAIDGFETVPSANGKILKGNGEIKIGEVKWSKINFDVMLDDENKPAQIKYDIK